MPAAYDLLASKKRVNVLKKVKAQGTWKLCPAVVEANGKLKDRVKVNGRVESHPEGVYYGILRPRLATCPSTRPPASSSPPRRSAKMLSDTG
jgi:hypothetical protein